jgi:MYXO-CTERM domain-containing protein
LDDDADVFKQWGPLAFAVAAADRPELQAGGSRSGKARATAAATDGAPAAPRRHIVFKWVVTLLALAVLAAGVFIAWKYGRRYLHV